MAHPDSASVATKHPRLALSIAPELREKMAELAERHNRTLSGEIATACQEWLARQQPSAQPTQSA